MRQLINSSIRIHPLRQNTQLKVPQQQHKHNLQLHIRHPPPKTPTGPQPKRQKRPRRRIKHLPARLRVNGQPPLGLKQMRVSRVPHAHAALRLLAALAALVLGDGSHGRRVEIRPVAHEEDGGSLRDVVAEEDDVCGGCARDGGAGA